jgi:hypothetical protein
MNGPSLTGERVLLAMATTPFAAHNPGEIAAMAKLADSTVRRWLPLLKQQRLVREGGRFGWWTLTPEGRSCAPVAARLRCAVPALGAMPAPSTGPLHGATRDGRCPLCGTTLPIAEVVRRGLECPAHCPSVDVRQRLTPPTSPVRGNFAQLQVLSPRNRSVRRLLALAPGARRPITQDSSAPSVSAVGHFAGTVAALLIPGWRRCRENR